MEHEPRADSGSHSHHHHHFSTVSPDMATHHLDPQQQHAQSGLALEARVTAGDADWLSSKSLEASYDVHGHHHHDHTVHTVLGTDQDATGSMTDMAHGHNQHQDHHSMQSPGHHGHSGHHQMGHMKPVFRWTTDAPVLFKGWTTSTAVELALAMLVAAILAAGYELLRNWLSAWDNTRLPLTTMTRWKRLSVRCFRAMMHALNAGVGYIQMLFAMTFDLRIFVAIILGSSLGFFIMGPYFRRLHQKHTRLSSMLDEGQIYSRANETEQLVGYNEAQANGNNKSVEIEENAATLSSDRETML